MSSATTVTTEKFILTRPKAARPWISGQNVSQRRTNVARYNRTTALAKRQHPLAPLEGPSSDKVTPHNADLIVADISGSMSSEAFDGRSKYSCLVEALKPLKGRAHAIAFSSTVVEVDTDALPAPWGGTDLTSALERAIQLEPLGVLVVSDGAPDNEASALEVAERLAKDAPINVLYIGPDSPTCKAFMRRLAEIGGGQYDEYDLAVKSPLLLGEAVKRLLLTGPSTGGAIEL